jgi:hypothetical protein
MQGGGKRTRLLGVCLTLGIGMAIGAAAEDGRGAAPSPAATGLSLVHIDAVTGVAIVRSPDGELRAWRKGEAWPDRPLRLQRLYPDRIEIVEAKAAGEGRRYWLQLGAGGATALMRRSPDEILRGTVESSGPQGTTR